MKIWVLLPAYNEEKALPPLLGALNAHFRKEQQDYSIFVINDGSSDRTEQVARALEEQFPVFVVNHEVNQGLAAAVRTGFLTVAEKAAPEDIIIMMDADNTHPVDIFPQMIDAICDHDFDVVIASRYQKGSEIKGLSMHRQVLSLGASWLFRLFLPISNVKDYTCGYRAYRAQVLQDLIEQHGDRIVTEEGFSCMVDVLLRLRQRQVKMTEVPFTLHYDLKPSGSKMRVLTTVFDTISLLVRRRLKLGK